MSTAASAAIAAAPRAVVFAYHDVGVRCLRVLLAHGVEVPLVLTHADAPGENIWFESVARHARLARHRGPDARRSERARADRARARARSPISCSRSTTARCSGRSCWRCRAAAPTTCTARCCRSTAAACRSTGRCCTASARPARRCTTWPPSPTPGDIVDRAGGADPARRHRGRGVPQGHGGRRDGAGSRLPGAARGHRARMSRRTSPPAATSGGARRATAPSTGGAARAPCTT